MRPLKKLKTLMLLLLLVADTTASITPLEASEESRTGYLKGTTPPQIWGIDAKEIWLASGDKSIPIDVLHGYVSPQTDKKIPKNHPFKIKNTPPMIAIIIDDLGMRHRMTKRVIDLPAPLTLSFLVYAENVNALAGKALAKGHEPLLHIPMEPYNDDPGHPALFVEMTKESIQTSLNKMLDLCPKCVGINNHMGSRFTSDSDSMNAVMEVLHQRQLNFVDSLTSSESLGYALAIENNVPAGVRDVFLDNAREAQKVKTQLHLLEKTAQRNGFAIGIGHPHRATIDSLQKWLPEAQKRGFILVPVSEIIRFEQGL